MTSRELRRVAIAACVACCSVPVVLAVSGAGLAGGVGLVVFGKIGAVALAAGVALAVVITRAR